ncbi:MAG: excinuclease ABC subunit B, partial [candidate division WOR-3 bacterium]|nr:excinuclease ABC subunit B [candidate division WOR-3 bacterium]
FAVKGNAIEIVPSDMEDQLIRVEFWDDEVESITLMDAINRHKIKDLKKVVLFPASHYVAPRETIEEALKEVEKDLMERVDWFKSQGKLV